MTQQTMWWADSTSDTWMDEDMLTLGSNSVARWGDGCGDGLGDGEGNGNGMMEEFCYGQAETGDGWGRGSCDLSGDGDGQGQGWPLSDYG